MPIRSAAASLTTLISLVLMACGGPAPGVVAVVVVEEHHLAWPVWEEARAAGRLPAGALVVHLDAHEDLGEPDLAKPLPEELDGIRAVAARRLDPSELVVPALLNGTIGEYVWVPPPWLEIEPERRVRWVGSHDGERRQILLAEEMDAGAFPDRRRWVYRVEPLAVLAAPEPGWVLDIDLDYFACRNPHAEHGDVRISREEYERLLDGAEVDMRGELLANDCQTSSIVLARPPGRFRWPVRLDRVRDVETDAVHYVRGCICMGEYDDAFPVHRPTEPEVWEAMRALRAGLERFGTPPALITVARSETSGFVFLDLTDDLEERVVKVLRGLWPWATVRR